MTRVPRPDSFAFDLNDEQLGPAISAGRQAANNIASDHDAHVVGRPPPAAPEVKTGQSRLDHERALAVIELETAIREAREGNVRNAAWDFLPVLTLGAMETLRTRARARIAEASFRRDDWPAYVAAEASQAWEQYNPLILPPDPVQPA